MSNGKTIAHRMEETRIRAGAQNYKGHDYMDLARFDTNTRHMIIFHVLTHDSPVGDKGDRMRLFLSDKGYQKALENEKHGNIQILSHAKVLRGNLIYDHKDQLVCFFLAQCFFDGKGLTGIVHGRAGAVGVDIDTFCTGVTGFLQCLCHGPCTALSFRVGCGDVVGIAGGSVAADLAVDFGTPGDGVLVFLQDQRTGVLPDDEAAPTDIEGQRGRIGILRRGQSLHVDEARNAHRDNGGLRTAGDYGIGIAVTDEPQSLTDGVGTGGACGDGGQSRTLAMIPDGDHTGGHVGDHHGHAQRADPVRTAVYQFFNLDRNRVQTTDAGTKIDRHPVRFHSTDDSAIFHRLHHRAHSILGKSVRALSFTLVHVLHGVKILDLCAQLGFVVCGIKIGDGTDAVVTGHQIIPCGIHIASDGADDTHAGNDNASVFVHFRLLQLVLAGCIEPGNTQRYGYPTRRKSRYWLEALRLYMAMPPSTRRISPVTYFAVAR